MNAVFSAAMFALVFGRETSQIAIWGVGNFAFDFMPQSFGVVFMSTLIPGFNAQRALRAGKVEARIGSSRLPSGLLLRALVVAIAAGLVCGAAASLVLWLVRVELIGWSAALIFKTLYGAALGAAIIPPLLRVALLERSTA